MTPAKTEGAGHIAGGIPIASATFPPRRMMHSRSRFLAAITVFCMALSPANAYGQNQQPATSAGNPASTTKLPESDQQSTSKPPTSGGQTVARPSATGAQENQSPQVNTSNSGQQKNNPETSTQRPTTDFATSFLAGGAINTFTISVPVEKIPERVGAKFRWTERRGGNVFSCVDYDSTKPINDGTKPTDDSPGILPALTKAEGTKTLPDNSHQTITAVTIGIPNPPCIWPPWQRATVTLTRGIDPNSPELSDPQSVLVSVLWFPLFLTLLIIGSIYPGCALIGWYIKNRRFTRGRSSIADPNQTPPDFWASLDPVQITANSYGRASLGKLQIFGFSLLIFGLMLFYLLRNGVIAELSTDVLYLLGISAAGATGGKLVQLNKRRLSYPNWAWLRRHNWLPRISDDFSARAHWRELITDYDGKEFDVYSFQMAIFSLVVAIALLLTNLSSFQSFHISTVLLGLLGISQGVFVVGRAADTTAYQELDNALDELRKKENSYIVLSTQPDKQADAEAALKAYRTQAQQTAIMFWDIYGEQIGGEPQKPAELDPTHLAALVPDKAAPRP